MKIISLLHRLLWQNTENFPSLCLLPSWNLVALLSMTALLTHHHWFIYSMSLHTCQAADPPAECVVGGMINLLIVALVWEPPQSEITHIVCGVALCRKKRTIVEITLTLCPVRQGAAFYWSFSVCPRYRSICV